MNDAQRKAMFAKNKKIKLNKTLQPMPFQNRKPTKKTDTMFGEKIDYDNPSTYPKMHLTKHNDNDDVITSAHNYWMNEKIPQMIDTLDEQLSRDITKSEKLDLMKYKKKLVNVLQISRKLGSRKMSFQE